MIKHVPLITAFPQDSKIYRLALIGSLDRNPSVESHPVVRVVLLPLRVATLDHKVVRQMRSYDARASKVVEIGVGLLPYLKIGTLWRNGKLVSDPPYETRVFRVSPSSRNLTPAVSANAYFVEEGDGGEDLPRRYYIPFNQYPLPYEGLKARLLVLPAHITDEVEVTLIVPCYEVFRFYYANSSPLTTSLLAGELVDHDLGIYNPDGALTYLDPVSRIGKLRLRQRMVDEDAPIAARIGLDSTARARASDINPSIVRNKQNTGSFVLDAYPPFAEGTTWKAHGQSYLLGRRSFFLIYWIETCTAAFPFDSLFFSRDNDGRGDGIDDPERPQVNWKTKRERRTGEKDKERGVTFDQEPEREEPLTKVTLKSARFLDLENKEIKKQDKDEVNYRGAYTRRPISDEEGDFGMGDGTHPSPLDRLSVGTKAEMPKNGSGGEPPSTDLEDFQLILDYLVSQGLPVELIPCSDNGELPETDGYSYVPCVGAWSYTNRRKGQRRRVIVSQVVHNNLNFCLLELERRPSRNENGEHFATLLLRYPDGRRIEIEMLETVLLNCAQNGGWPQGRELRGLHRHRFIHRRDTSPEDFGNRIINYMEGLVTKLPINSDVRIDSVKDQSGSIGDAQSDAV